MASEPLPTRALLPVFLAVIAVTVIGFLAASREKKPALTNGVNVSSVETDTNTARSDRAVPAEPTEVYSRSGTISSIGSSSISVRTPVYDEREEKYSLKEITVRVNEDTEYREEDRRRLTPIATAQSTTRPSTNITFSSLRSGDAVQIVSSTNMRGETTVTAEAVIKLLLP